MADRLHKKTDIVNNLYYGIPTYFKAEFSNIPFKEEVLLEGDRIDIIAEQLYGNPGDWRYIALFNNIGDFFDFKPGVLVKFPINIEDVKERI